MPNWKNRLRSELLLILSLFSIFYLIGMLLKFPLFVIGAVYQRPIEIVAREDLKQKLKLLVTAGFDASDAPDLDSFFQSNSAVPEKLRRELYSIREQPTDDDIRAQFRDLWGRPIRCVSVWDDTTETEILGLYSEGPDWSSSSKGEDPDDINSWSAPDALYWNAARQRFQSSRRWRFAVTFGTAFYVLLKTWALLRYIKYRLNNKSRTMAET